MPTIYIDTDNFLTATAAYLDAALTTKAPDGYYRYDGNYYRQQIYGLLLAAEFCPEEPIPIGTTVTTPPSLGTYRVRVDVGTATGMMMLVVTRSDDYIIPKLIYNGVTYRTFYCADTSSLPYGGVFETTSVRGIGSTCIAGVPNPVTLPQWGYNTGLATWVDSGSLDSGWISTSGIEVATVDNMYLPVYKSSATPTYVDVEVTKYCSLGAMSLKVENLSQLTPMITTPSFENLAENACLSSETADYFMHNGVGAEPAPGDFIFLDDGTNTFPIVQTSSPGYGSKWYFRIIATNRVVEIFNGYVISVTDC